MKKIISWILFILTLVIFIFDVYAAIFGAIDVKKQMDELIARGASGHEYLGVGDDILVLGIIFISVVGLIFSIVSLAVAQNRVIRNISFVLILLFLLMIFTPLCLILL